MMYLVGQLWLWLLLTAAFAALAGWGWASERAAPGDHALRRDRENLVRDLSRLAGGENGGDAEGAERELDAAKRLVEIRDGRIAELEQALTAARARGDETASRLAELERAKAAGSIEKTQEAAAAPIEDDQATLQAWRLRYFEQRVRYLEGRPAGEHPATEWRAREAEARAAHLEQEVRTLTAPPTATVDEVQTSPFAASADVDILLRWRLLYLERRVAYLQEQTAHAPELTADGDRWRWRARYLEARVRHLEQSAAPAPVATPSPDEAPAQAAATSQARAEKPPMLPAARNGAPDDFTLIEDVSVLQQITLYSIGVFHFDQIAAWTPANVAWVDQYLRLRGRIEDEEWVMQAQALAAEGVGSARRLVGEET